MNTVTNVKPKLKISIIFYLNVNYMPNQGKTSFGIYQIVIQQMTTSEIKYLTLTMQMNKSLNIYTISGIKQWLFEQTSIIYNNSYSL